jgi:hypothetical protein
MIDSHQFIDSTIRRAIRKQGRGVFEVSVRVRKIRELDEAELNE